MRIRTTLILCLFVVALIQGEALPATAKKKPVIHFGVIPRYNPIIMYRSYQPMMDYLSATTQYHFELKLSRNYQQAVSFLQDGTTPVASLGDVTFVEARRLFGAVPILKPLNREGNAHYHSIIIVRDNGPLYKISDLKGKTFAFGDPHSTSGNLIPRDYLLKQGLSLFDLKSYTNLESHDAVAKAVLKGTTDAGAVKDVVAYRYREHGLRFLSQSYPIPSVPIVVRRDAPPELVDALIQTLGEIDTTDPNTTAMLESWDPEFSNGFVPASLDDYKMIFDLIDNIPEGCGIRCH